jgi:hypothetical protein
MLSLLPEYTASENVFFQPQTQRYHFPFRSPRNTERMNLFMGQVSYDIYTLYGRMHQTNIDLSAFFTTIYYINSTSIPVALGYLEVISGGSLYDLDNPTVISGGGPTTTFQTTIQGGDLTTLSTLFENIFGMEALDARLEGYMKRLDILERGVQ